MNRSPDDIFAAQFWAWPDPALKRDAHGRVLFVNAAFLQLYGGTVEAWRGQIVDGWAFPQPGPVPARFEIRTPAHEGMPEQVYDWLESCGPDGSGFAIARNVTAFATPQPIMDSTAVHSDLQLPVEAPAQTPSQVQAAHSEAQPALQAPAQTYSQTQAPIHAQVAEQPAEITPAPPLAAPPELQAQPVEDIVPAPPLAASQTAPQAATQVTQSQPTHQPPANLHELNPLAVAEPERDFERRPLPIENDEAVLGNNWRDAVIARAVGGEEDMPPSLLQAEAPNGQAPKADAIRILLAEDNAINALLTRTLLEADGHSVETVEDGLLAVEAMKTQNFDMIFMDMRMPNMDGLEATRKIRSLPNVPKDLPIVALTANAFDDDRNACFDSGMNDFMTKPVSAEELSEMVIRWTSEQAAQEQKLAS